MGLDNVDGFQLDGVEYQYIPGGWRYVGCTTGGRMRRRSKGRGRSFLR
jgi:hypothetical protein